jgi:hypothetical protein
MTDPLTGKELVEKSYEYIVKLTKECAKSLVDEFSTTHRKFLSDSYAKEVSGSIIEWFGKREKNVKLAFDSSSITTGQPNISHIKFKGSTKDSDFSITSTVSTFTVPSGDGKPLAFVKTLVFSVEKSNFSRRKP